MKFKVFFSYAHEDELLLEKLKQHLMPLKSQGLIHHFWYDREISAGTEWEPEIAKYLDNADIILLLISPSFMSSEYCFGKELQRAIGRHERKEARVIPIILNHIDWQIPPLNKLQALPTDGKPVISAEWHNIDEAFFNVARGLRIVINSLQKHHRSVPLYQFQFNHINQQLQQGTSALIALQQCDPELAKLFEWVMRDQEQRNGSNQRSVEQLQYQIEKLLDEVSAVGDGDLRIQAEVSPDTLGVLADSFNYLIEELAKIVGQVQAVTFQFTNATRRIIDRSAEMAYASETQVKQVDQMTEAIKTLSVFMESIASTDQSSANYTAVEQQAQVYECISVCKSLIMSMRHVSEFILQADTNTQETAVSVSYLAELSEQLRASVSKFSLPDRTQNLMHLQ